MSELTKKKTPVAASTAPGEDPTNLEEGKIVNTTLSDIPDVAEGRRIKLTSDHPWFAPIRPSVVRPVGDVDPKLVALLTDGNPASSIHGRVYDDGGQLLPEGDSRSYRWPQGTRHWPANTVCRVGGLLYVSEGTYFLTFADENHESVEFRYSGLLPCSLFEWCAGHSATEAEEDRDSHWSDPYEIHDFASLADEASYSADINRVVRGDDGAEQFAATIEVSCEGDADELTRLAIALEVTAEKLRAYAIEMDARAKKVGA